MSGARVAEAEAHLKHGNALQRDNRPAEALESYDRALAIEPASPAALLNRAYALRDLKRPQEALASCERALALQPAFPAALKARGDALLDLAQPAAALASLQRALALEPRYPTALTSRALALIELDRPAEALASCDQALTLDPALVRALKVRGDSLFALKRGHEAVESYERALALNPRYAAARLNAGLCRLSVGDFGRGWKDYEARLELPEAARVKRGFNLPRWTGAEPIAGKTLLLHADQGLGDTIHFCRYADLLAKRGAIVALAVQPQLKSLLATLASTPAIVSEGESGAADLSCPLLSAPLACGTRADTIPADVPYLASDPRRLAHWQSRLGPRTAPRIGLVWSGNPQNPRNRKRAIPLAQAAALVDPRAQFVSLQKEASDAERSLLAGLNVAHFGEELRDFGDTAALVDCTDLVVTVDTAVAHLAGAMGKRTWILLPYVPDWRWLWDRDDSPWYPSVRLFRQPAAGDWESVLRDVGAQLRRDIG